MQVRGISFHEFHDKISGASFCTFNTWWAIEEQVSSWNNRVISEFWWNACEIHFRCEKWHRRVIASNHESKTWFGAIRQLNPFIYSHMLGQDHGGTVRASSLWHGRKGNKNTSDKNETFSFLRSHRLGWKKLVLKSISCPVHKSDLLCDNYTILRIHYLLTT